MDNSHNLHQWLETKDTLIKLCCVIFPTLASASILFRFFMQTSQTHSVLFPIYFFFSRCWFSLSESGGDRTSLQPFSADKHTKTGRKTRSIMAEKKSRLCNIIMSLAQPQVHIYAGIFAALSRGPPPAFELNDDCVRPHRHVRSASSSGQRGK